MSQVEQEWDLTASLSRVFLVVHVMPQAWAFCGVARGRKWRNILIHVSLQAEQKSCGGERMKKAHSGPLRQSLCWLLYHCMQQGSFKKVQHMKWHIAKAWKLEDMCLESTRKATLGCWAGDQEPRKPLGPSHSRLLAMATLRIQNQHTSLELVAEELSGPRERQNQPQ